MLPKIIKLVDDIKVNKQNGAFAVYKPLLLMIILRQVQKGQENKFVFKEIYHELESLMDKYGWLTLSGKKAQYPFYFLASSELWEINIDGNDLKFRDSPSKKEMENATGKLSDKIYDFLVKDNEATKTVIKFINNKYFKGEFVF